MSKYMGERGCGQWRSSKNQKSFFSSSDSHSIGKLSSPRNCLITGLLSATESSSPARLRSRVLSSIIDYRPHLRGGSLAPSTSPPGRSCATCHLEDLHLPGDALQGEMTGCDEG